jgi:hypothetical protein
MANPLKGEVDLVAGETTYTLRMSINEIVQLETLLDLGVMEISALLGEAGNPRLGAWRAALWASLQCHHKGTTLEDAGEIIALAGFPNVMGAVGAALQAAFPTSEPEAKPSPRKASRRGTGKPSA